MDTEALRSYCLSLPGATESIKWEEHLAFCVAAKIFCMTGFEPDSPVVFKINPEQFETLCEHDGIGQAPHFAKRHWVQVRERNVLPATEWCALIRASYDLVVAGLPKKVQAELKKTSIGG